MARETAPVDVCHVVALADSSGSYGGPFSSALEQCRTRLDNGLRCTMYAGVVSATDLGIDPVVTGVLVRSWSQRFPTPSLCSREMLSAIWKAVGDASTVHIAFGREIIPIFASIATLLRRRTLVIQPHGMLTVGSSLPFKEIFDRFVVAPVLRRAERVIALTERESEALTERYDLHRERLTIIGNGMNLSDQPFSVARSRIPSAVPEVLFLGRLHPRKRVIDFITAASISAESPQQWRVVGPDGGDLELVIKAHREGIVSYEGSVAPAQVYDRLNRADVFVLPSISEPWGNVLVAALALGIPSVVTRSADLARLVEDYNAGIVVADNDPAQVARAVNDLIGNDDLYKEKSRNAISLARDRFDQESLKPLILQATRPKRHLK